MKPMTIHQIASFAEGVIYKDVTDENLISHVTIDSRQCRKGSIFIPLKGSNWDGHHFIKDAAKQGATACFFEPDVISGDAIPEGITGIAVNDCQKALENMAMNYRNQFDIPVISITGSNGKTTTKDMLASVLSSHYQVLKNPGNYNNHIGLPLSIMALNENHQIAVLEMGMSGPGEISLLSKIARPDYAIITNIGMAHVEKLGNRMNIANAKKEITDGLEKNGVLIINRDDDYYDYLKENTASDFQVEEVGLNTLSTCYAREIKDLGQKGFEFKTNLTGDFCFKVRQPGLHNVINALFAIRTGLMFELDPKDVQQGLDSFKPTGMRMEICRIQGADVVNDAYNANPDSMKAAVHFISKYPAKRKIAVLGDMYELGEYAEEAHREIGREIINQKIDYLITVGNMSDWMAEESKKLGMGHDKIIRTSDYVEAAAVLKKLIQKGDVVLLKASRVVALEKTIDVIGEGVQ
ncbi:MAG: UDP-N-acetylmuramoyl-tripeptide--D-alanyl-D-alanine ligase [Tindallia sp. MSAO_Bac2]|nr:MAG: UDP-N-acetylmuramoyl-tripeptide--D-alanyl-D-alanine ligase [Tindallia sp. MSAO_Bac2]